jgi:hypothetical protein
MPVLLSAAARRGVCLQAPQTPLMAVAGNSAALRDISRVEISGGHGSEANID